MRNNPFYSFLVIFLFAFGILFPFVSFVGFLESVSERAIEIKPATVVTFDQENREIYSQTFSVDFSGLANSPIPNTAKPSEQAPVFLYIPFFEGDIQLYFNKQELNLPNTGDLKGINYSSTIFLELPSEYSQFQDNIIKVQFLNIGQSNHRLSSYYIGERATFSHYQRHKKEIIQSLRLLLYGAVLVLLIFSVVSYLRNMSEVHGIPLIITQIAFLLIGSPALEPIYLGISQYQKYFVLALPMSGLAYWDYARYLRENALRKLSYKGYALCSSLLVISIIVVRYSSIDVIDVNLFVSIPLFIALIIAAVFFSLFRKMGINEYVYQITLAIAVFSFVHDYFVKYGYDKNGFYISNIVSVLVIICVGVLYSKTIIDSKELLRLYSVRVKRKLELEREKLKLEYEKIAELESLNAFSESKERLYLELHDGVLNYLSIIAIMSEKSENERDPTINKLARYATNEIRVILDNRIGISGTLIQLLSSLRAYIFEPLEHVGVNGTWDISLLVGYRLKNENESMDVVRMVQECFHNAVVRGSCKTIDIEIRKARLRYVILISNSGGVSYSNSSSTGNGIKSMKKRAKRIGGRFYIKPSPSGAVAAIFLPAIMN